MCFCLDVLANVAAGYKFTEVVLMPLTVLVLPAEYDIGYCRLVYSVKQDQPFVLHLLG